MTRWQSLPRTAASALAANLVADRAIALVGAAHDLIAVVSVFPSQLLTGEMSRRPVESTQYLSIRRTERLADAAIDTSVGSVGDSYDNAMAETIIGLYKTEEIRPKAPWRSIEDVEFATASWVEWFNNRMLFTPIGDIPPVELEQMYYQEQATPAVMAGAN